MKNLRSVGVLPAIALGLSYAAGCRSFESLTYEEEVFLEHALKYVDIETPFVKSVAEAADHNTIFDSTGTTGAEAYSQGLDMTVALLHKYHKQGKIVVYNAEDFPDKADATAFYNPIHDVIALNRNRIEEELSVYGGNPIGRDTLVHEACHAATGIGHSDAHEPSLEAAIQNEGYTCATAETAIRQKDSCFLSNFLVRPADRAFSDPYDYEPVWETLDDIQAEMEYGGLPPEEAYKDVQYFYCPPIDEWVEDTLWNMSTTYFTSNCDYDYLPTFGITEPEFSDRLPDSRMYQTQREIIEPPLTEFIAEDLAGAYTLTCNTLK